MCSQLLLAGRAFAQANPIKQELRADIQEEKKSDRKYTGEVIYTLMGRRFDDPFVNSRWGRAIIEANFGLNHEDWLEAKLSVAQLMTSGATAYQLGVTEAGPTSGTFLNEATLSIKPNDVVKFSAGVLDIDYNSVYSLFLSQAQAGANLNLTQKADSKIGKSKFALDLSQSIPTSVGRGNIITDEGTYPLLTLATLYSELKNEDSGTRIRGSVTHYEYTDLSTSTAADSLRTGSTVLGSKDFQFAYEFRGREYALGLDQEFGTSNKISWKGSLMSNERAPKNLRDGWQQKLEYARSFNKWKFVPSVTQFRVEGDTLPASYSIASYGYTNRQGYNITLKADVSKQKFNMFIGYTNAKALISTDDQALSNNSGLGTYQADREIYTLGAEVAYDIF